MEPNYYFVTQKDPDDDSYAETYIEPRLPDAALAYWLKVHGIDLNKTLEEKLIEKEPVCPEDDDSQDEDDDDWKEIRDMLLRKRR